MFWCVVKTVQGRGLTVYKICRKAKGKENILREFAIIMNNFNTQPNLKKDVMGFVYSEFCIGGKDWDLQISFNVMPYQKALRLFVCA